MCSRDNILLVLDMQRACEKILTYVIGMTYLDFLSDTKTQDAVVRNFEIIGEAASRVLSEFKFENPQVPWKKLKAYRNRLIHEYFGVDYEIVWDIIQGEVKDLSHQIETITQNE